MSLCETKSDLECRIWDSVDRFHGLSSRLADLAGTNRYVHSLTCPRGFEFPWVCDSPIGMKVHF